MKIFTLALYQSTECDREHETPTVFAGVSSLECITKFKSWFPDAYEMDLTDEGQRFWDEARSYAALYAFFEEFYCSFRVVLNDHEIS